MLIHILGFIFIFIGLIFIFGGTICLIRVKDDYNKLHFIGMIESGGMPFFIIGVCILYGSIFVTLKLLMILFLFLFVSPVTTHIVSKIKQES